jgi:CDP-diacylglycerol--glycerol-3-phosphate 3-phosphatidyltransferase
VAAISVMLLATRHRELLLPGEVMMWGVIFFALLSAVSYFRKFWRKVDARIKQRRRRELLQLERRRQKALLRQRGSRGNEGALGTATISNPPEVS